MNNGLHGQSIADTQTICNLYTYITSTYKTSLSYTPFFIFLDQPMPFRCGGTFPRGLLLGPSVIAIEDDGDDADTWPAQGVSVALLLFFSLCFFLFLRSGVVLQCLPRS